MNHELNIGGSQPSCTLLGGSRCHGGMELQMSMRKLSVVFHETSTHCGQVRQAVFCYCCFFIMQSVHSGSGGKIYNFLLIIFGRCIWKIATDHKTNVAVENQSPRVLTADQCRYPWWSLIQLSIFQISDDFSAIFPHFQQICGISLFEQRIGLRISHVSSAFGQQIHRYLLEMTAKIYANFDHPESVHRRHSGDSKHPWLRKFGRFSLHLTRRYLNSVWFVKRMAVVFHAASDFGHEIQISAWNWSKSTVRFDPRRDCGKNNSDASESWRH